MLFLFTKKQITKVKIIKDKQTIYEIRIPLYTIGSYLTINKMINNNVVKNNPIFGKNIAPTIDSNNFILILTIKILLY